MTRMSFQGGCHFGLSEVLTLGPRTANAVDDFEEVSVSCVAPR